MKEPPTTQYEYAVTGTEYFKYLTSNGWENCGDSGYVCNGEQIYEFKKPFNSPEWNFDISEKVVV